MKLSANFDLSEMTVSQSAARLGLSNKPGAAETNNLKRLCQDVLQPLRDYLKKPVLISSGYRSPAVNRAVGGASTSAHMTGRAADIHVPGLTTAQLVNKIHGLGLPIDQVIDEFGSWVHVGIAPDGSRPRGEYLAARNHGGQVIYSRSKLS